MPPLRGSEPTNGYWIGAPKGRQLIAQGVSPGHCPGRRLLRGPGALLLLAAFTERLQRDRRLGGHLVALLRGARPLDEAARHLLAEAELVFERVVALLHLPFQHHAFEVLAGRLYRLLLVLD